MRKRNRQLVFAAAILFALLALWASQYFTGDQDKKVGWSANFTIDTSDPDSLTRALTNATSGEFAFFSIDTRDPDSLTRALTLQTTKDSNTFTIDTRDPDWLVFATSGSVSKFSSFFSIDTREDGSNHSIWGTFLIDTRDPDGLVYPYSLVMAMWSQMFTIDTRQPPPEDSDADGLHDLWEILYFGSVFAYGPDDDPDGDGIPNFMEFAMGTDPLSPNAAPGVEFWVETGEGGANMFIRYRRHILAARMVNFEIIMSEELRDWIDETQRWTEISEVVEGNGYVEQITLIYPVTGDTPEQQFVKLQLTPIPISP